VKRYSFFSCLLLAICSTLSAWGQPPEREFSFREVLALAGVVDAEINAFDGAGRLSAENWRTLAQVWYQLDRFPAEQLAAGAGESIVSGNLVHLRGRAIAFEPLALPAAVSELAQRSTAYRVKLQVDNSEQPITLLTAAVPRRWLERLLQTEPVECEAVVLGADGLFATNHLAWYPQVDVPTGLEMLAAAGMDVSLLDEVRHNRPFVTSEESGEAIAFYQCLAALGRIEPEQLEKLALANVTIAAKRWSERPPKNEKDVLIAEVVSQQAAKQLSSVVPPFYYPGEEEGELVRLQGTARRAVRIAATGRAEVAHYFEMELYTGDSENLPIVCCVRELPRGFPMGDAIREPVRISGVFFKGWRYRSRESPPADGKTTAPPLRYTPVVLAVRPVWLEVTSAPTGRAGWWGGVAFLTALVGTWWILRRVGRGDRRSLDARIAPTDLSPFDLPEPPSSHSLRHESLDNP
jgi:hypothetical protein